MEKQITSDYIANHYYDSYGEYKFHKKESELRFLIGTKYMKILREFIENMYPDLRFDIHIKYRNTKERMVEWYGHTYMKLIIFDVINQPVYNPLNFEPSYRIPNFDGYINGESLYNDIESYIPEINKHLVITFSPLIRPHESDIDSFFSSGIPDFECWKEHYRRECMRKASIASRWDSFNMF